ncbi:hypothetical protein MVEN_00023200 [Mycena venus]|uniref:Uncharacterized protein n=1 Tax=Mycena venus TaxID=2733690 RepID=A0A8H6Z7B5_9AGAR|nr:hypothetical protein MVEN_00023200 [Mycena venus]
MREGLLIWDAIDKQVHRSFIFSLLETADGPAMADIAGLTGHMGTYGCRQFCSVKGHRKPNGNHYYPALLKPTDYNVDGCNHDDVNGRHLPTVDVHEYSKWLHNLLSSDSATQYQTRRRDTSIVAPSLFSGLPSTRILPLPRCFCSDSMHLYALNLPDLLISLWRGTMQCDPDDNKSTWDWAVLKGKVWDEHGAAVANAAKYLPGCFNKPPGNPVEKMNSGYKAQEYLTYLYVLGPALLCGVLPQKHWIHFCKLVCGIRPIWEREISHASLLEAHQHFCEFEEEFEQDYYQQIISASFYLTKPACSSPCYPGNYLCGSQRISQPVDDGAHHRESGRGNQAAFQPVLIPTLEPEKGLPQGAEDLGNGYVLLCTRDEYHQTINGPYGEAIRDFLAEAEGIPAAEGWMPSVARWARLRLPNGQIVRSVWKDSKMARLRIARNIKYKAEDRSILYGEVQFFFQAEVKGVDRTFALLSVYSPPDAALLEKSFKTVAECSYFGEDNLQVIEVTQIRAGIGMIPIGEHGWYFVAEKLGLDIFIMGGEEEDIHTE